MSGTGAAARYRRELAALHEQMQRVLPWFTGRLWPDQCQASRRVLVDVQAVVWQWRAEVKREQGGGSALVVQVFALAEEVDELVIALSYFQEQCRQASAQTAREQYGLLRKLRKVVEELHGLVEEER